jgi:hypothetical protein
MIEEMNIEFSSVDDLFLDPLNPRVGRHNLGPAVPQKEILEMVEDWALDELARSYLENGGFWLQEALLVVQEPLYDGHELVVVEGNRRLAALKFLKLANEGQPTSARWRKLAESAEIPEGLFEKVPYILLASRKEIQAYLGFRHVTGIKQWDADEKAYFIAKMIDEQGMNYEQVMRMIGSTTPAVRRHYLAYHALLQIESEVEDYDRDRAEDSFSLLYMALETEGAREFLQIQVEREPPIEKLIPASNLENLKEFAVWLFGSSEDRKPIISDTRQVSMLGAVLKSGEAVDYLRRTSRPDIEYAYQLAGGEEEELLRTLQQTSDALKHSLSFVYDYRDSRSIQVAVRRLATDAFALLKLFPSIRVELLAGECEEHQAEND